MNLSLPMIFLFLLVRLRNFTRPVLNTLFSRGTLENPRTALIQKLEGYILNAMVHGKIRCGLGYFSFINLLS